MTAVCIIFSPKLRLIHFYFANEHAHPKSSLSVVLSLHGDFCEVLSVSLLLLKVAFVP